MSDDPKPAAPKTQIAPPSIMTKPGDAPARPGFRSPTNTKSKAQQKKKK
ncbi:hypothetical protein LBMAG42_29500 [Deltaproteobacteria bacterium]|nr:hypothetical protein LBMAG42_29500 [Deltaproteobacteria bacterium]